MTVGELIAALQAFPAGLPVVVNQGRSELANGTEAKTMEAAEQQRETWTGERGAWYGSYGAWRDPECEYRRVVNVCGGVD